MLLHLTATFTQNFYICGLLDFDEYDGDSTPMSPIQEFEAGITMFKNDGTYIGVMSRESREVRRETNLPIGDCEDRLPRDALLQIAYLFSSLLAVQRSGSITDHGLQEGSGRVWPGEDAAAD